MATPINFNKLVKEGALKKIEKSYYIDDPRKLPSQVSEQISVVEETDKGIKLTFEKESKLIKKLAEDSKERRD